ncbi:MAG: hypothetical protein ACREJC_08255 [Tepidisphaeraceae bacterium]
MFETLENRRLFAGSIGPFTCFPTDKDPQEMKLVAIIAPGPEGIPVFQAASAAAPSPDGLPDTASE